MAFLTIRIKGVEGYSRTALGKDRMVVGPLASATDIPIKHTSISREHCALIREGERWLVEDLGSSNGTWVGRTKVASRMPLEEKAIIKVGQARLTFHGGELSAAGAEAAIEIGGDDGDPTGPPAEERKRGANDPPEAIPCGSCGYVVLDGPPPGGRGHAVPALRRLLHHSRAGLTLAKAYRSPVSSRANRRRTWPMPPLVSRVLAALTALGLTAAASASDALIKPGRLYAAIDSEHLHVLVPAHAVDKLKPFVARAELIYCRIARDAGYRINGRLTLLLSDDAETHNGYSTTVPVPIVDIDLPSATQESFIFDGDNWLERTLTHELTHHVSNDREPNAFLHTMEEIFGRILPNDDLSLIFAFFTIPSDATMPSFWQEGCAQWTETVYSPANSVWRGRGHDSLTHMVWRLAAATPEGIPTVDKWRLTWPRWPYGNMVYIWGMGYLRYLDAAYGDRATVWQLIAQQEQRWPFLFNGGPRHLLGKDHLTMIAEERAALQREQEVSLATLRTAPVTETRRMTPVDSVVSSPAWTRDGQLFAAYQSPYFDPCYLELSIAADGSSDFHRTRRSAWAMGDARSLADGTLIYSETDDAVNPWNRFAITVIDAGGAAHEIGEPRMLQPDIRAVGPAGAHQFEVVALHLLPAARQELALFDAHLGTGLFSSDRERGWRVVPTQGNPWSPAFRRGHAELSWVETDPNGSRLVLAPLSDLTSRTVLAQVRGRILLPSWTADGSQVFICADHSGVANAYCIEADHPGTLIPVTNTIGGVLACVPSFDGKRLGVVDCDLHGPYLSALPMDRAAWATQVPSIPLPFPAPLTPEELQIAHSPGPNALARDVTVLTGQSHTGRSMRRKPPRMQRSSRASTSLPRARPSATSAGATTAPPSIGGTSSTRIRPSNQTASRRASASSFPCFPGRLLQRRPRQRQRWRRLPPPCQAFPLVPARHGPALTARATPTA